MWIPFAGIFIGMWGMPDGEYAWHELPQLARYSLLATGVFFFLTFALFLGSFVVRGRARKAVRLRGRPARAEIIRVHDTLTTVNEQPLVRFTLNVTPSGHPAFEAQVEQIVSRLEASRLQPGTVVPVKYLPNSREVAIVEEPATGR